MGVVNLMPFVKSATKITNIKNTDLPNSTAAIDMSVWIYKAGYGCPEAFYHKELRHNAYKSVIKYIDDRIKFLKEHKVEVICVFDGMKLPAKQVTNDERAIKKAEARRQVEKFLKCGDKKEARNYMIKCLDVKFDIVKQIIEYCKREDIKYVIAPYEADAQLAWLSNHNLCQYIITEDSDLILYGCQKIIYKLDISGSCQLYEKSKLGKCFGSTSDVSFEKFRRICILSGCDYLRNIPGVGLQSAKKFFLMSRQDDLHLLLPKLATNLENKKLAGKMTKEYIKGFIDAESTFKHQIVYDLIRKKLTPLEPYSAGCDWTNFPLAGRKFHHVMASDLVSGKIDLDNINPETDLDDPDTSSEEEDNCKEESDDLARPTKMARFA